MCRVSSARAASDGLHMTSSAIHSARFRTLLAAEEGGEQGNAFGAQPNSDSPTTATPLVTPTSGKKSGAEMSSVTGKESIAFVSPRSDVGNGASTDRSVREHISLTATEKLTSVWACVHRRLAHAWDEVVIAKRNMVNRWQLRYAPTRLSLRSMCSGRGFALSVWQWIWSASSVYADVLAVLLALQRYSHGVGLCHAVGWVFNYPDHAEQNCAEGHWLPLS
eukprot:scaffold1007_cov364-Prasinococcus_capsulatus_cf.AAC.15